MPASAVRNHYETLQLSPKAEQLVITKVYRLLAAYYHPDNKQTGDEEEFKLVLRAYEVLSDPAQRAKYDIELFGPDYIPPHASSQPEHPKSSSSAQNDLRSKLGSLEEALKNNQESNLSERELRKLLLLALYDVRRNDPNNPEVSLLVLTELLGSSLETLQFSIWYLKEKGFIKVSQSADFAITVIGVDHVEQQLLKPDSDRSPLSLPEWRH